jgi:hypothetical protein
MKEQEKRQRAEMARYKAKAEESARRIEQGAQDGNRKGATGSNAEVDGTEAARA